MYCFWRNTPTYLHVKTEKNLVPVSSPDSKNIKINEKAMLS